MELCIVFYRFCLYFDVRDQRQFVSGEPLKILVLALVSALPCLNFFCSNILVFQTSSYVFRENFDGLSYLLSFPS